MTAQRPPEHARQDESWSDQCKAMTRDWLISLRSRDPALAQAAQARLPVVRRQAIARTLMAMGREGLLPAQPPTSGRFRCTLPGLDCVLIGESFQASSVLLRADVAQLEAHGPDGRVRSITDPAELLQLIARSQLDDSERWRRLAIEITDSVLNEALALAAHARSEDAMQLGPTDEPPAALIQRIRALDQGADGSMFLDQWSAIGHPLHTVPKARLGLSPAEAIHICPEFHPTVPVRLSAIQAEYISSALPSDVARMSDWFAKHFPQWHQQWALELSRTGLNPDHYDPFPVHPWQADHVLKDQLQDWVRDHRIALLDGPSLAMRPGLSVRSLVPEVDARGYGLKLALSIRLTSGIRTITPRSCHMGRRVSALLDRLFEGDLGYQGLAGVIAEPVGAHLDTRGQWPEMEKQYSFIARDALLNRIDAKHVACPAAALAEPFPSAGQPLLLRLAGAQHATDSLDVFEHYARDFLLVVLRTHLVYGIALEAHGQNTVVGYDDEGRWRRFWFRDLAGIRIHEPTLHQHGIELDVHPDRRTVVQDFEDHHFWLRHRAYHAHLGHIAHGLSVATGINENRYWQRAAAATADRFDQLRPEVDSDFWLQERRALLEAPWKAKASFRMRLMDQVRDLPFTARNPLLQG
ncbi:MAG: IucA/IucC family protein [Pseudomonadota bacterium]